MDTSNRKLPLDEHPDVLTARYLGLGRHRIAAVKEVEILDRRRDKKVPVKIYAPESGGPYPVIVFSHGAGDSNDSSPHLMRHWASHGYVVLVPTHYFGERPFIERSLRTLGKELMRPFMQGPAAWNERVDDMKSLIDTLPHLSGQVKELEGRCDPENVGIAGHSFGAYTVMLMGGATLMDKNGTIFEFADPRPRAILMISGPGHDAKGLTQDSYGNLTRPLMVFAGSHDPPPAFSFDPMWRAEPYERCPPGDKHLVFIRGANHMSYIGPIFDRPMSDPGRRGSIAKAVHRFARLLASYAPSLDQVGMFDYTRIASVAFWEAYLKDDADAMAYLHSKELDTYSRYTVRLKHR